MVTISSELVIDEGNGGNVQIGFSVAGSSTITPGSNGASIYYSYSENIVITTLGSWPVVVTPGSNTFTVEAQISGAPGQGLSMTDTYITVQNMGS
jgi:hypothetical protein